MHFLTPHVEISMAENDTFKVKDNFLISKNQFHITDNFLSCCGNVQTEPLPTSISSALLDMQASTVNSSHRPLNGGSPSPHSADSNSNAPSSSQSLISSALQNSRHHDGQITPSISLIPIKQVRLKQKYLKIVIGDLLSKCLLSRNQVVMIMKAYQSHCDSKVWICQHPYKVSIQ